ncbi:MAG: polysaccharide deacetylase family protein [Proteobacteria bacterium]|nr:polysaccharide deacetylase family protein [Pseudomonadota bacterium]
MSFRKPGFFVKRTLFGIHSLWMKDTVTQGPKVPEIALTFDDGPDERWTSKICSILEEQGAVGSFFMVGEHLERLPTLARDVVSRGHEPCVHLYSHNRSVADNDKLFLKELQETKELIEKTTYVRPVFLRFPFAYPGHQNPDRILHDFGLRTIHWSFSSLDSRLNAPSIVKRVRRFLFPGAIVLLHDGVGRGSQYTQNREATVEALPGVLEACRELGFATVTLSSLLRINKNK